MIPAVKPFPRGFDFQEWLVARSDASQHAGQAGATRRLAAALALPPGARVLDVGCGSAKSTAWLARTFAVRAVGLDRSPHSLARARWRIGRGVASTPPTLVRGDALALPFATGCFDGIVVEAVAYAAPLDRLLPELRRVLAPGGRLGIVDIARRPGAAPPHERFQTLLGERTFNLLTAAEWAGEVRAAGFRVDHVEAFPIRQELGTIRSELGDWLRSLPRQLAWLATSRDARRLFFANYRVGLDRGVEGCLLAATHPRA
ncbi:MAG: class I SAM-dependent methyltransferase [bacterium]